MEDLTIVKELDDGFKISEESAEDQYKKLEDFYDIDPDEAGEVYDEDDKEGKKFARASKLLRKRWIRMIRKGIVSIVDGENGSTVVVQELSRPLSNHSRLTYAEVNGEAKIEMSKASGENQHEQIIRLLGSLSGIGYRAMSAIRGRDSKVADMIATFFFQV
jgi:hypothetical protein